ncbi:MAG: OmpA family protein [Cyclobacteriaceae bacterium]|nr:OmpA family protein [Cyclobacteriaceae bacterium]
MKKKLTLVLLILTVALNFKVSASKGQLSRKASNYVVIGAFSIPKNAIEFTNSVKQSNPTAEFSINPLRNLFYVYVLTTADVEAAFNEAKKLRLGGYSDAWVFSGVLGEDQEDSSKGTDTNPITRISIEKVEVSDNKTVEQPNVTTPENGSTTLPTESNPVTTKTEVTTTPVPVSVIEEVEAGSKKFLFKVFTNNQKEIQGDIDVMDLDKTKPKKVASYRANEPVNVKPANKSGNVSFVCEVFGYRKIQTVANFNQPEATEGITIEENKAVVPFELVRLKKGDFAVMYNVYFFKDAGIMRPESKYEVNSLLDMLKENPKYKIKIHGHTNGNSHGKVISMGDSKNFFGITVDVKEGFGSAKKLSEERALVIQNYLISQGVDPSRMQVKAWGGKKPVYEEDHALASANVRVEIEILED